MITGRGGGMMRGGRIRPPRRPQIQAGGDDFEQCWEKLRDALRDIHMKDAGSLSFEQLYRYSYKIVLKKAGEKLYDRVKEFEEKWFNEKVMPPILALTTKSLVNVTLDAPGSTVTERRAMGDRFLRGIRESWENHNTSMNMIADILMYLERGYSTDHSRPSIFTATIGLYRDHILRARLDDMGAQGLLFNILNATILDHIDMERNGDVIDKALIRSCVSMLEDLHETDEENDNERLYLTEFEPAYLIASANFYRRECENLIRESDARAWLRYTQRRLAEEADRCQTTISPLTQHKIANVVELELITKHFDEFMNLEGSGIRAMIDNDRLEDLKILYQLVSRVEQAKIALRNALSVRVIDLGHEIEQALRNTDFSMPRQTGGEEGEEEGGDKAKAKGLNAQAQQTAAAIKWVDDVLMLKDKFDGIWESCFEKDLVLQTALTKSFSDFINQFDRSSEYVSLFIDDNLKRGIKGKTEAEVDKILEKSITLIRFLTEKDKFEQYYQKHLARRLLHGKSASTEAEAEMISRMKQELGNNFTMTFEGMFKDMNISKDITEQYREYVRGLGDADEKRIDLSISVLASNNWPKEVMGRTSGLTDGTQAVANFPPDIKRLQESFFKFYEKDRNGRKLTWVGSAGVADITCRFPKTEATGRLSKERKYEITVSTYGMVVLLLFNDLAEGEWLSFEEIQAQTNIPQVELINTLTSLAVMKQSKVLLKEPQTKAAAQPGDSFTFNREFWSKMVKIKVPSVNAANRLENDEERRETEEKNLETRKHVADAAIVRIMKSRKELPHPQLLTETIDVLKGQFKPEVSLLKNRIEALIAREYLERSEMANGMPGYKYMA